MATVKFFAAARQFAKIKQVDILVANKLDLISEFQKLGNTELIKLAQISTFLINGKRFSLNDINEIKSDDVIEMLPPFAGG